MLGNDRERQSANEMTVFSLAVDSETLSVSYTEVYAQVYATPCVWLCRERETVRAAAETTPRVGICSEGCPGVLRRTWVGCGVSVEGERKTSEDCCASEEQAKEKGVSCEWKEARGCSDAGWAGNSGEEGARATCVWVEVTVSDGVWVKASGDVEETENVSFSVMHPCAVS